MAETIKTGTILIKDGTFLPAALQFDSELCATGWRLVKKVRCGRIGSKSPRSGWTFSCLAGEIKATIFGFGRQRNVHRAVKQVLTNLKSEKFNGLEIMQVAAKRFLGLPYATVCAHSRHIQESLFLLRVKDLQEWDRAKLAAV
jgi:hypothetical protein